MRTLFTASFLIVCASFALPAAAQEAPALQATIMLAATEAPQPLSILGAVRLGNSLLKADVAARAAAHPEPVVLNAKPSVAAITLAVWEKGSANVMLLEADKSGTDVIVKTPGNWPVRVIYNNRQFSQYAFPAERNAVVVGVRYPAAITQGTGKKKTYTIHDTVYTPYVKDFYAPEVLSAGSDYLSYLIQDAFDELREKAVKSRAYPDRLVADVIDPYLLKSIVVIEHSDHATLLGTNEPEQALGRFLVKLGLNGEDAFDAALSPAGAAGLVQFIPSTYKLYVDRRPDLALIPDFTAGMSNHKNAIKAEVAYLDQSLAGMPAAIRDLYVLDKTKAAEFLAAAYNGGETRVKKAFATFGPDAWFLSPAQQVARAKETAKVSTTQAKALKSAALRDETATYVAKLRKTYSMLSAGMFATPAAPSGALPVLAAAPVTAPTQLLSAPAPAAGDPDAICVDDGGCSPAF